VDAAVDGRGLARAGRAGHEKDAAGLIDRVFKKAGEHARRQADGLQIVQLLLAVEQPEDDFLAVDGDEKGDAQIQLALVVLKENAARPDACAFRRCRPGT
jgi:hypothetical protein